jgi:hypothetical protein
VIGVRPDVRRRRILRLPNSRQTPRFNPAARALLRAALPRRACGRGHARRRSPGPLIECGGAFRMDYDPCNGAHDAVGRIDQLIACGRGRALNSLAEDAIKISDFLGYALV